MPKTEVNQVEMPAKTEKISLSVDTSAEKKEVPPIENMYKGIKRDFTPKPVYTPAPVVKEPSAPVFSFEDEEDVLGMCKPAQKPAEAPEEEAKAEAPAAAETAPAAEVVETVETIETKEEKKEAVIPDFRVIGEAFNTYILVQTKKELLFLDKHAAHERIIFNSLKNQDRQIYSQMLMTPVTVTLSAKDYDAVLNNLEVFRKSGYCVDDFGEGTVRVTECPTELSDGDVAEIVAEIADKLAKNSSDPEPEKLDWLYHSTACRAAIKAGDRISLLEMEDLVKKVFADDEVRYCPHGRPVMFSMSEYEIKKLFGRNG